MLPDTESVNAPLPPTMELGVNEPITGAGLAIVKVKELEVPPPGAGLETATDAVPAEAMSDALTAACNPPLETKVVVRALPFHRTVEEEIKFVPLMVRVRLAPPAVADVGFKAVTDGKGFGLPPLEPLEVPPHAERNARETTELASIPILKTAIRFLRGTVFLPWLSWLKFKVPSQYSRL